MKHNVKFFLFREARSSSVGCAKLCQIYSGVKIIYENGVEVSTGFVTNLIKDKKLWLSPSLGKAIRQSQKKLVKVLNMPRNVFSPATLQALANKAEIEIEIKDIEWQGTIEQDGKKKENLWWWF